MKTILFFISMSLVLIGHTQECRVLLPAIDSQYIGNCKRGLADGDGTAIRFDSYTGQFKKGMPHGVGKYIWRNGDVYEGSWYKGKREGQGRFVPFLTQKSCEGTWRNDRFVPSIDADDYAFEFRVKNSTNIEKVSFRKTSSLGNTIRIRLFRNSSLTQVYELSMSAATGDAQQNADYPVFTYVSFPFAARLEYKLPDKGGATLMECLLDFVIIEEGEYDVLIYH